MKKTLFSQIEIPKDVEIEVEGPAVVVKGPKGEVRRTFKLGKLELKKEGDKVVIGHKKSTKREKKNMNTISAHIKNMIKGVQEKFEYKLKICFSHFPFSVSVSGDKVVRAEPLAAQAQVGNIRVARAGWTPSYLGELTAFPMGTYADQVDASSGAFNKLAERSRRGYVY